MLQLTETNFFSILHFIYPIKIEWPFLKNIVGLKNPFDDDIFYDIKYIETFDSGVSTQLLDTVKTHFYDDQLKIEIEYCISTAIKAFMIFIVRITDPHLKHAKVTINGNEYFLAEKTEEQIFNEIGGIFLKNSTTVNITLKDKRDFEYSKGVLVYEITQDFEDSYYLNKELARWDSIKK